MHTDAHRYDHDPLSERVIGCAYVVANTLGAGFLEKVYENALAHEMRKSGLKCIQQHQIPVIYDGVVVGEYVADLMVNDLLLIELKAIKDLEESHMAQCINYLKGTGLNTCLLINFGRPRIQIRRVSL